MSVTAISSRARRLAAGLEPVVGQVYFSPECHANYRALGFDDSPGDADGVALPDGPAYFASRGSVLGQVPGEVIASAFGVFNPLVVVPSVSLAWTRTDADTIRAARADGAVGQLRRLLGDTPEGLAELRHHLERAADAVSIPGRPLAAGIRALPVPDDDLAAVWHLGDLLREFRGDSHTISWVSHGLNATEIGLLTELYWGLPLRSYSRTRGWSEEDFDRAESSLRDQGLLDGDQLSPQGRARREEIEVATDVQVAPVIDALGGDLESVCATLDAWGAVVRDGRGYLPAGPHDLAAR